MLGELPGFDVPVERFVAIGQQPPWDGELLAVSLLGINQGPEPGTELGMTVRPAAAVVFHAQFAVTLLRQVTILNNDGSVNEMLPTSIEMLADGEALIGDAGNLVWAATQVYQRQIVTDYGQGFVIGPCLPLNPDGGYAGTRLAIAVSVG